MADYRFGGVVGVGNNEILIAAEVRGLLELAKYHPSFAGDSLD